MNIATKIKNFFQVEEEDRKRAEAHNVKDAGSHVFALPDLLKMKQMRTIGVFSLCLVKSHIQLHRDYERLKIKYNAMRAKRDLLGRMS